MGQLLATTQAAQDPSSRARPSSLAKPDLTADKSLPQLSSTSGMPDGSAVARPPMLPPNQGGLHSNLNPVVERPAAPWTPILHLDAEFLGFVTLSPLDEGGGDASAMLIQALAGLGPPRDPDVVADRVARVEVDCLETAGLVEAQDVDVSRRPWRRAGPDPLTFSRDHPR